MFATIRRHREFFAVFVAVLLCLTALTAALTSPSTVSAHAAFVWGTPNNGDTVSAAPSQVDAHFAEDIVKQHGTYGLSVMDQNGNEVDNQDTVLDDNDRRHMTVTLQSNLADGTYAVHWWTVSDQDGDAAYGDFSFTVSSS